MGGPRPSVGYSGVLLREKTEVLAHPVRSAITVDTGEGMTSLLAEI